MEVRSRRAAQWLALIACGVAAHAAPAAAYCVADVCNPDACPAAPSCSGPNLHWDTGTASIAVDAAASSFRELSADQVNEAVADALSSWSGANCPGGGHPALHVQASLDAHADDVSFVKGGHNQNVITFFDENWPYQTNAVAKTILAFDEDTGALEDADIALNSDGFALALDDHDGHVDLTAVLTHELGHLLGLGHSAVAGATMQPETMGFGTADLRSLESDDIAAICALYPPAAGPDSSATPAASCSVAIGNAAAMRMSGFAAACILALLVWRRGARKLNMRRATHRLMACVRGTR